MWSHLNYSHLSGDKHCVHSNWHHGTAIILVLDGDLRFFIATIDVDLVSCIVSPSHSSYLWYALIFHTMTIYNLDMLVHSSTTTIRNFVCTKLLSTKNFIGHKVHAIIIIQRKMLTQWMIVSQHFLGDFVCVRLLIHETQEYCAKACELKSRFEIEQIFSHWLLDLVRFMSVHVVRTYTSTPPSSTCLETPFPRTFACSAPILVANMRKGHELLRFSSGITEHVTLIINSCLLWLLCSHTMTPCPISDLSPFVWMSNCTIYTKSTSKVLHRVQIIL